MAMLAKLAKLQQKESAAAQAVEPPVMHTKPLLPHQGKGDEQFPAVAPDEVRITAVDVLGKDSYFFFDSYVGKLCEGQCLFPVFSSVKTATSISELTRHPALMDRMDGSWGNSYLTVADLVARSNPLDCNASVETVAGKDVFLEYFSK